MSIQKSIIVQNVSVQIITVDQKDYISITDMANAKENESRAADIIKNWIRNRYTLEFLGTWEKMNNQDFKVVEFDHFKMQAGLNTFVLSVSEWIDKTNAIGFVVKKGRYGGTYAHKDIAFEFGASISAAFKLYLIKEFQRLKDDENDRLKLNWNLNRTLAKINYRIHTDAIKSNIPENLRSEQISHIYANEADVLNVALFGKTAKRWRDENPDTEGNIRDYSTIEQLLVLANLESLNAEFIKMGLSQSERLVKLNQTAISQMKSLALNVNIKKLKS
ncbi:MAG: KilA-N domain-containing protein [Saprospiraceae bacterium]|mgnify:CR=1 FL=1|nr:KilA-N domain-containing protein [Saprospiraceae bacterium]